jgi:hypothetical protein
MAFKVETDTMGNAVDKETLEVKRATLQKEIDELLNDLGYGFTTGS